MRVFRFKVDLPLWWFPSFLTVLKEYALGSCLGGKCPLCGSRTEFVNRRSIVEARPNIVVSGDRLVYRCGCGAVIEVEFMFRSPREGDDIVRDFALVFSYLLRECCGEYLDYERFSMYLTHVLEELADYDRQAFSKSVELVAKCVNRLYFASRSGAGREAFNRFRLLLNYLATAPENLRSAIEKHLSPEIVDALRSYRDVVRSLEHP